MTTGVILMTSWSTRSAVGRRLSVMVPTKVDVCSAPKLFVICASGSTTVLAR